MSAREVPAGAHSKLLAPLHRGSTRDNLPQFKTYASTAFEPEAVMGANPLTPIADAIGNFVFIVSAVVLGLSAAASIIVFFAMLLFMEF